MLGVTSKRVVRADSARLIEQPRECWTRAFPSIGDRAWRLLGAITGGRSSMSNARIAQFKGSWDTCGALACSGDLDRHQFKQRTPSFADARRRYRRATWVARRPGRRARGA